MPQVIIGIILLFAIGGYVVNSFEYLITLQFLPHGIVHAGHGMFDGNLHGDTYIPIIGLLINYVVAIFINIVDFLLWFLSFVPGLSFFMDLVYSSPDLDLSRYAIGIIAHRSFLTHSVLNPVFLILLFVMYLVGVVINKINKDVGMVLQLILVIILMAVPCHLLADTMPQNWYGAAYVNFKLLNITLFPSTKLGSILWLYGNAYGAYYLIQWTLSKTIKR